MAQIYPDHLFSHQKVVINDNTEVEESVSSDSGDIKVLYVFASPKGPDRVMTTVTGGAAGFRERYGLGPFALYGQPLLMAYAGCQTGNITAHCLRVTAEDAQYARLTVIAQYKFSEDENPVMNVRLVGRINEESSFTNASLIEDDATVQEADLNDGYTEVKLFTMVMKGRGEWGNNYRFRFTNDAASDKENSFKNYIFQEYYVENGSYVQKNEMSVAFTEYAKYSGVSLFADTLINAKAGGSELVTFTSYPDAFVTLFEAYKEKNPATELTAETFDPLLGINKFTKASIANLTIDMESEDVITVNGLNGVALLGGNDGELASTVVAATREETLNGLYLKAFEGEIDPMIKSKNKFPTTFIYDANFDIPTKIAMVACGAARKDCVTIVDCGLGIKTKSSVKTYVANNLNTYVTDRVECIEAYAGKTIDPYSGSAVPVTSTYALNIMYPAHIMTNGNGYKHVPMAGNNYGVLQGFIEDSVYPVFDEDVDADLMDELCEERINFAALNVNQDIIRKAQTTRQERISNLSELNNVLVLLDVKRDCEKICSTFDFNFSMATDIALFNTIAKDTLSFYADQQVTSITAEYSKNAWEAKRNIVHLNVAMAHRDIVKHFITELDVNRSDSE